MSVGGLLTEALGAAHLLNLAGISVDIYNLRFVAPIDPDYLLSVLRLYDHVVLAEEGVARGGVGEHVARVLGGHPGRGISFRALAAPACFPSQGKREQLLAAAGLDAAGIAAAVRELCERGAPLPPSVAAGRPRSDIT